MTDPRSITCEDCGGAGGLWEEWGRWHECFACDGFGHWEVPTTPITQADLDANTAEGPYIVEDDSE